MGSAALLHPLLPLPKPSLRCPKPRLAFSSRLSIPAAPPLAFLSTTIRRNREPAVLLVRASSEDEGTAGDLEAATEQEDAPQDETAEANPEASEAVAEVEKPPRKPRVKFGDVIGILHQRAIEASLQLRPVPDIRPGDIIELRWFIPGRRRPKLFKGIVIAKNNAGIRSNIRVRRIIQGGGVEITFPLHSPKLREITVVKHRKVRRAKLYYWKNLAPRFSVFK